MHLLPAIEYWLLRHWIHEIENASHECALRQIETEYPPCLDPLWSFSFHIEDLLGMVSATEDSIPEKQLDGPFLFIIRVGALPRES